MRIVIIPARGGSKGIRDKNLQFVGGRSLVQRAIVAALKASTDLIILSTDSEVIAAEGRALNVVIHNRANESSGDSASSESVIAEVIRDLGKEWPEDAVIALIQATSPFILTRTINDCMEHAVRGYVGFSASESHKFLWIETSTGWEPSNHPSDYRPRRQELGREVQETGAVYAFPKSKFQESGYRFCAPAFPVIVPNLTAIDIDSIDDLYLANAIASHIDSLLD